MLEVVELFAGIGGFSLGLEATGGFKTVAFCEIDGFCQKVLAKNWPGTPIIEDVHNVSVDTLGRIGIRKFDVLTAGFPCQPFSAAGKQLGESDPRHLWPQIRRVISEFRPKYVLLENVPGILSIAKGRTFGRILWELAQSGYDAEWQCVPASAFGAWHRRDRVWIIAYPMRQRRSKPESLEEYRRNQEWHVSPLGSQRSTELHEIVAGRQDVSNPNSDGLQAAHLLRGGRYGTIGSRQGVFRFAPQGSSQWDIEPGVGRVVDGIPNAAHRIRSLGNAVVPPAVTWVGQQVLIAEGISQEAVLVA